ncbi:LysR family transcriptional regulator [Acetobacteraceae bacterium KSS8]|uniref:LysR family transcriptional regulator n=1 Tax=Endosaccharibacter trunci TaxID=2812733 RepID=A0ABT1W1U4_9PROT|nr:LysR family transcriptional regulator [Acetobacteraceae bacterium KSS8]
MLDLFSVRLFILTVEFGSLTRAAEAAGTVQPVVSARLKGLEAALGRRLLERTPRFVRPTADGTVFLAKAQALMAAHDDAASLRGGPAERFAIGFSDHALGAGLERMLGRLRNALPPGSVIDLRLDLSQRLRAAFDDGLLDAVIVRREAGGSDGEVLGHDRLGWRAGGIAPDTDGTIPLLLLHAPCGVRGLAIRRLDAAGLRWREAFSGGSCATLLAAVRAGLGVAPMGAIASGGMEDAGPRLGLPDLPESEIVMFARAATPAARSAIRTLEASVRGWLRGPASSPVANRDGAAAAA